jgi:hypothetical protein
MSDPEPLPAVQDGQIARSPDPVVDTLPPEIEKLPPEMRAMVSVMAGFFRSTSGPDPETARILAETERHEETCKLEGFTRSLRNRDKQSERDHRFRMTKLTHETIKSLIITGVCVAGIVSALYLIVAKKDNAVGTPLLVASFMALLGGKSILQKDKD